METLKKQELFWDFDVDVLDAKAHKHFIIERILARGDLDDVQWAMRCYGAEELKRVVLSNHSLDKKSQAFWCLYFNINPTACTRNQSMKLPSAFSQR